LERWILVRSTLFLIPHQLLGIPLFGFGWLLACLLLAALVWGAWALARKQPWSELVAALPVWLVAMAVVTIVLPNVEMTLVSGEKIGLPIRGYGVLVLIGLLTGIGITVRRGQQLGILPDTIVGLGFWMMLGGIIGARLFYVVQKWNEYEYLNGWNRLIDIFKLTEGGLVIYGGVAGGLIAGGAFCWRHHLKLTATADLIAPGFLIGYSIGRIGCLLHGCCFGGVCTAELPSIRFPAGSVPYNSQLASGELLGIKLDKDQRSPAIIADVRPESLADQAQIVPGQQLQALTWGEVGERGSSLAPPAMRADLRVDGEPISFTAEQLPALSLPTHPSQIYASINALLLCLLIWHIQPLPRRDGVTFCLAVVLYAFSRFLLEGVRSDEAGQFGTSLTIAQIVGLVSGLTALLAWWALSRFPRGRAWTWPQLVKH
jgi:phosphatidylglycerol:prolipoprotein diacylglycerol transferase